MIPLFIRFGIEDVEKHSSGKKRNDLRGIWIPVFLIYPILLLLFALLSPFIIIIAGVLVFKFGKGVWRNLSIVWRLFTGLRGLHFEIESKGRHIVFSIS